MVAREIAERLLDLLSDGAVHLSSELARLGVVNEYTQDAGPLALLERMGAVTVETVRSPNGKGRPKFRVRLVQRPAAADLDAAFGPAAARAPCIVAGCSRRRIWTSGGCAEHSNAGRVRA